MTNAEGMTKSKSVIPGVLTGNPVSFVFFISLFLFAAYASMSCATDAVIIQKASVDRFFRTPLSNPSGVFLDRQTGELYITDAGLREVLIFDRHLTPAFSFGGKAGVLDPIDIVVKDNRIYLAQGAKDHIEVFSYKGEPIARLKPPDGIAFEPGRLAIDASGRLYAVNKRMRNCVVFDREDKFLFTIGEDLKSISGVAVSTDRVYIIAPFNERSIMVYGLDGKFLYGFEAIRDYGGTLGLPSTASVDGKGRLWLADAIVGIVIFDKNGKELTRTDRYDNIKIRLKFPVDIELDSEDRAFVADKAGKTVGVFVLEQQ